MPDIRPAQAIRKTRTRRPRREGTPSVYWQALTIDSIQDPLFVFDSNGVIVYANQSLLDMLGYREEEFVGQPTSILVSRLRQPIHLQLRDRYLVDPQGLVNDTVREGIMRRKDGSEVQILRKFSPVETDEGLIVIVTVKDISEHKARENELSARVTTLEEELRSHTEELEERIVNLESFSASVSHDLRWPLRAMRTYGEAMLQRKSHELSPAGLEFTTRVVETASEMERLIEQLIEYSRQTRGTFPPEPVNLLKAFNKALLLNREAIQQFGASVTVAGGDVTAFGHEATIIQILGNLIRNAVTFAPPGEPPQIRLDAVRKRDRVRFWVEDKGIGIPREEHERIFRIFERLQGSEAYPGTGIGLAVVKKGAERMGGKVGVESAPGQGSRFWVDLPAC